MDWYIGTIGFGYDDWRDNFYPAGMRSSGYLAHYSLIFNAVEIDSTFHAIPRVENLMRWANMTPAGFKFCVKMPKEISHSANYDQTGPAIKEFSRTVQALGEKLAVILIQFPPAVRFEHLPALDRFFALLPAGFHFAVEVRHQSWYTASSGTAEPPLAGILRQYGICWAANDYPRTPKRIINTADFLYLRWIGQNGAFAHHTSERIDRSVDIEHWKRLLEASAAGSQQVFGFFSNDYAGFAPGTANRFKTVMGLPVTSFQLPQQGRLF